MPRSSARLVITAAALASVLAAPLTSLAATPRLEVGITHTRYSADQWRNPAAVARAKQVLRSSVRLQAQALMGWGTTNPEPSDGVYDWRTLDQRLQLIASSGGTPVVTLCCAPDWMKGGLPGTTDWARLEVAPRPEHYDEFADLAVEVAKRHPQLRTFVVWNELKGFHDRRTNTWDIAAYTRLYNTVYAALKAHDPTLRVGGPYVSMALWANVRTMSHPSDLRGRWGVVDDRALRAVTYWLKNARGYDFVAVDGGTKTKDKGLITTDVAATEYFAAVTRWLRARTTAPIWWTEFYPSRGVGASTQRGLAVLDAALGHLRSSGASVAMSWEPEGANMDCVTCLWTATSPATGGQEAGAAAILRRYNRR